MGGYISRVLALVGGIASLFAKRISIKYISSDDAVKQASTIPLDIHTESQRDSRSTSVSDRWATVTLQGTTHDGTLFDYAKQVEPEILKILTTNGETLRVSPSTSMAILCSRGWKLKTTTQQNHGYVYFIHFVLQRNIQVQSTNHSVIQ
jgi:hypothetical protein